MSRSSSFSPSFSSSSSSLSRPSPPPFRSHALCLSLLLLLVFSTSTTAAPYYDRDWNGAEDDGSAVFETYGSTSGSSASPSDTPSLSLPRSSATPRIETTPDRSIRAETVTPEPTIPSPQIVTILPSTLSLPTVISTVISIYESPSTPEATSILELQNTRMMEIVANLTKKIRTQAVGTSSDISISFTPDELKKLQEIIGATDEKLKDQLETTNSPISPNSRTIDVIWRNNDIYRQKSDTPSFHNEEHLDVIFSTTASTEENFTVISDETTLPPTEPTPGDLVVPVTVEQHFKVTDTYSDVELPEPIRPALCKLNTDDEVISVIWMFLQSRIREWGYDEDQSTVLVLATFGLLLDTKHSPIEEDEPGFLDDMKAAIQCLFRDCRLAMPNKKLPERLISMPSSPKKRETVEYHSELFECRCPSGYVFI